MPKPDESTFLKIVATLFAFYRYDYIAEPTLADAIMDRLVSNAVHIELKGESMRRKNRK